MRRLYKSLLSLPARGLVVMRWPYRSSLWLKHNVFRPAFAHPNLQPTNGPSPGCAQAGNRCPSSSACRADSPSRSNEALYSSPASFLSVGLASPTISESRTPDAQWTAAPQITMLVSHDRGRSPAGAPHLARLVVREETKADRRHRHSIVETRSR
jgi:hypothetical protein